MRGMKPQKQLLQFVMLALLSVVSVLVTSGESAAMDCTSCHGTSGSSMRPQDGLTRDPSTGAFVGNHVKHLPATPAAAACNACHNNGTDAATYANGHRDGKISFNPGVGYSKGNVTPALSFTNQTSVPLPNTGCSAASCHNPYTDGTPKQTPNWGGTATCTSCHNYDTAPDKMATNAHGKHLAVTDVTVSCATCHTNPGAAGHVDGNVTVNSALGYAASTPKHGSAAGNFTSTCTASCHDTGRSAKASPVWSGSAAACTACHDLQPATLSHPKHLTSTTNATFACGVCHAGAVQGTNPGNHHLDTMINISAGKSVAKAKGSAPLTCSTVYCHSNVQPNGGVGAPTTYASVTWGGTAICGSCHDSAPITGSHTKHMITGIAPTGTGLAACANCHTAYGTSTHGDGVINITTGYSQAGTPGNGYGTCSTASCHDVGRGEAGYTTTPVWATSPANCSTCHGTIPATGSHDKHVTSTTFAKVACGTCHVGAVQGSNAGANHLDTNIDTDPALGYPQNKTKGSAFATCATTYCHSTVQANGGVGAGTYRPPTWGTPLAAGCSSCHDAQPSTGSHTKHIAKDATCDNCHSNSSSANHVNGSVNVGGAKVLAANYNGTPTPGDAYGSCSTSQCHSGNGLFTPASATWGGSLGCNGCHGFPPSSVYHNGITGNCNSCHSDASAGTLATTTITNPTMHMNGVVDGGECNACHGYPPVKAATNTYGKVGVTGNYTGARIATNLTAGGVHDVKGHLSQGIKPLDGFTPCLNCHPQGITHNQGFSNVSTWRVQVVVDPKFKFNKDQAIVYSAFQRASTTATGNCTNVSCHFQTTPQW